MSEEIDSTLLERFKVIRKMGSGAYGHVFKVQDKADGKTKALKKNFDAFSNSTDAQRTYRQIMFLFQLKHPNVIHLHEVIKAKNGKDIYLVFQFLEATLYDVSRAKGVLGDHHRKYILYQVALALYYLHSAGIMHRDLKPANVLVNENCISKLIDFGLVRSVEQENQCEIQEVMTQYIATRWYRAPQIILGSKKYSKAVDIWSFGCLVAEVYTGKPLFPGNSTLNQIQRVFRWTGVPSISDLKSLKTSFGKQLIDLVSHMKPVDKQEVIQNADSVCMDLINKTLQINSEKRLTIEEVLMHPYFQEHFSPKDLIKSKKKIQLPVDDKSKLTLKQYRSLIYEQISKLNVQPTKQFESKRQKSSQTSKYRSSFSRHTNTQNNKLKQKNHIQKNHSEISETGSKQEMKTIKYESSKKNYKFFEQKNPFQNPMSRLMSREKAQRKRFSRGNSFSKHENLTTTVAVRPKRFSTQVTQKKK